MGDLEVPRSYSVVVGGWLFLDLTQPLAHTNSMSWPAWKHEIGNIETARLHWEKECHSECSVRQPGFNSTAVTAS